MIRSLRIKNFVLVDDLELAFSDGLNVITGETGAGKSVIIGALNLVLGQKVKGNVFYDVTLPIYLEAVFGLNSENQGLCAKLIAEGYLSEDEEELIFVRELLTDGSSRSYLNGRRVNLSYVRQLKELIIDFHSQRDQVKLFDNTYQLDIIDTFGGLLTKRVEYQKLYSQVRAKMKRLQNLQSEEKQSAERQRLFEFQIAELEDADLKSDEEKELQQELDLLTHSDDILNDCSEMRQLFFESENTPLDQLGSYLQRLDRFSQESIIIREVVQSLKEALQLLYDSEKGLRKIEESIDLDQTRMERVEERMRLLLRLKNKYKMEVPQLIDYLNEMKSKVASFISCSEEIERLKTELEIDVRNLQRIAEDLSLDRKQASLPLKSLILENISRLAIPEGDFEVRFPKVVDKNVNDEILRGYTETGKDRVEFVFSANRGIDLQALRYAVSGGELSRLLLVFKKILAGKLDTLSLVFDEIDSGVGGLTAKKLAEFINDVAKFHQVICITHLAQIAGLQSKHYHISKEETDTKTVIKTTELSEIERKSELARMLAGSQSETALKHAEEILSKK